MLGFDGDDTLDGNAGNDILKGGSGNDQLTAAPATTSWMAGTSGGSAASGPLSDNFNGAASYSRNSGTSSFTGSWSETGDGTTSPSAGDIRNESNLLRFRGGSDNNDSIQRSFSLAGTAGATLSFSHSQRSGGRRTKAYASRPSMERAGMFSILSPWKRLG